MKVLIYSDEKFKKEKVGWFREGQEIKYAKNSIKKVINDHTIFVGSREK